MGAFTFVLKKGKGSWSAKRTSEEEPELSAEAGTVEELQKKLFELSQEHASGGGVSRKYSTISPTAAVFQVVIGAVGGGFAGGGGGAGAGGAAAAGGAAEAKDGGKKEEKKEEEEEEEDEDMGFSLFD